MTTSLLSTIEPGIVQVVADAFFYIVDAKERIAIDTGSRKERNNLNKILASAIPPESIKKVIFTHAHYDHVGNFDFFPNAKLFMHEEELQALMDNPEQAVLQDDIAKMITKKHIRALPKKISGLDVIHTPGHTKGSVCLWWEERRTLFTGDTLFHNGMGRVDLPTSQPEQMGLSLGKLVPYQRRLLCPGH